MTRNLTILGVLILSILVTSPAYAAVKSANLQKDSYTIDEQIVFEGTEDSGQKSVFIVIRSPSGEYLGMVSDPSSDPDGSFETIKRDVKMFFKTSGIYNATAFTDDQKEKEGIVMKLKYDGKIVTLVPDFTLSLKPIGDKTINEKSKLSFLASVTDSSLTELSFSLGGNPPSGAAIDPNSGVFTWTPSESQGPGTYMFEVIVSKGGLEDRETISVTVNEVDDAETLPKPDTNPEPTSEPTTGNQEPEPEPEPESNESKLAPFVDPNKDPQYYIDRYNNEPKYKDWFDTNYPDMTIYEAVGLDAPKEPEIGQCGEGTKLENGVCVLDSSAKKGGGCLIATAAYGTELAPQVQFLREIRDNTVLSTSSGAAFMTGFNQFYYSFSPTVADWERENPIFQESVRAFITPMISSLSILTLADQGSESSVLGFGLAVIALNIGLYIAAPTVVGFKVHKYLKSRK